MKFEVCLAGAVLMTGRFGGVVVAGCFCSVVVGVGGV